MTPKKLTTRPGDREQARSRARIADKYLEVAQLVDAEGGAAVNVDVSLGKHLRRLASAKPASHYGERLLGTNDRAAALRAARALVAEALRRTR